MDLQRLSSFHSTNQLIIAFYLEVNQFNFCCQAAARPSLPQSSCTRAAGCPVSCGLRGSSGSRELLRPLLSCCLVAGSWI